jgi:tetratricopeptide (TPR) repeat protein
MAEQTAATLIRQLSRLRAPDGARGVAHLEAVHALMDHQRKGTPWVLVLRNFNFLQLFTPSYDELGQHFENMLARHVPAGVPVIEVQDQVGLGPTMVEGRDLLRDSGLGVEVPSLHLPDDSWFDCVQSLIRMAEMIVVLLHIPTPGVVRELEAIAAAGREDRTVVLFSELSADPAPPILDRFPRTLSVADLDTDDPLGTVVFTELFVRLAALDARRTDPPPIEYRGLADQFADLGRRHRAQDHAVAAARCFANVARLATLQGEGLSAVEATIERVEMLPAEEGQSVVRRVLAALGDTASDTPSQATARAQLMARLAALTDDYDEALRLLDEESVGRSDPSYERALSILLTARAQVLARDPAQAVLVLDTAERAFHLARAASAPLELARALYVVGAVCHAAGEFETAGSALRHACEYLPSSEHPEDLIMILIRLGDVIRDAGYRSEARSVYDGAARTASVRGYPVWSRVLADRVVALGDPAH